MNHPLSELKGIVPPVVTPDLPDGSLDRRKLGEKVFSDAAAKNALNAIVYPAVEAAVREKIAAAKENKIPLLGVDAINLLQSGIAKLCDLTVAVTAAHERRLARIVARDHVEENYALLRIKSQENDDFFTKNCTKTLKNNVETEEKFAAQCDKFLQEIIKEYKK